MPNPRIRVYAWEFPVRFTHWINFLALTALSITGLLYRLSLYARRLDAAIHHGMDAVHSLRLRVCAA